MCIFSIFILSVLLSDSSCFIVSTCLFHPVKKKKKHFPLALVSPHTNAPPRSILSLLRESSTFVLSTPSLLRVLQYGFYPYHIMEAILSLQKPSKDWKSLCRGLVLSSFSAVLNIVSLASRPCCSFFTWHYFFLPIPTRNIHHVPPMCLPFIRASTKYLLNSYYMPDTLCKKVLPSTLLRPLAGENKQLK